MRAERNENGDVAYYLILCPQCKVYSRIHAINTEILSGSKTFWCYSDTCKASTVLQIVNGCAVDINHTPKADLGQDKPKPKYEPVSTEAFTKQRIHNN